MWLLPVEWASCFDTLKFNLRARSSGHKPKKMNKHTLSLFVPTRDFYEATFYKIYRKEPICNFVPDLGQSVDHKPVLRGKGSRCQWH